jgi:TIR domain-containing protein
VSAPIFISYSSKDQDIAETIYQALESRGQSCWIACRDVHPGENFQEAIVRALRSAKVMLLVFTANANNSDEIKKELVLAGRHHVTVVPVRVEDVVPNDAFTYEFATRQWIDLYKNWEHEIELLASRLEHVLATAKAGDDAPADTAVAALTPRRLPKRSSKQPLIWGGIGVAAIIAVGGGVFLLRPTPKPEIPLAVAPTAAAPTVVPKPAPAPPQQTAAQAPPPALAPPVTPVPAPPAAATTPASSAPQTAAAPPPPPPPATPQLSPEDAAWQAAELANTVDGYRDFQKNFPGSFHVQGAQLRTVDLLLLGPATAGKMFDGTWQTTYTCSPAGSALGFTFQFATQVKDGVMHGVHGTPGERSSLVLDGKLASGGDAAMIAKGVVGAAAFAAGGQPGGTPYAFHATAHFEHAAGAGRRIEGRECELTFAKQ